MSRDPLHYYVQDSGSPVAHHWDYIHGRTDHALCGQPFESPEWEGEDRPKTVCEACESSLPRHEARWWRSKAASLEADVESLVLELEILRARLTAVEKHADNQRVQLGLLNAKLRSARSKRGGAEKTSDPVSNKRKAKKQTAKSAKGPDNSPEAVLRRQREQSGPLAAADISTNWRKPPTNRRIRAVSGGLPGLGKRR